MEKSVNYAISEFKQKITNDINTCGLPIGVLELVIGNIYNEITILNAQQVAKEAEEYKLSIDKEKALNEPSTASE